MANLLEKLWPAFVSEFTEQLDSGELLLVKSSSVEKIDVNHLFRNFHTIKGNCSMMGFTTMETLAHKSEDILAAVRSESITMTESVVDILLDAISALKKQFQLAHETRENPPQDEVLLTRLSDFIAAFTEPQHQVAKEDRHQYIDEISSIAKTSVPSLVLGLDKNAKIEKVESAVKLLANKAEETGFPALSRSLTHYLVALHSDFDDKQEQLIIATAEVFDDIEFICEEYQADLGLELAATLCRSKLNRFFIAQLNQLQVLLQQLANMDVEDWQADQFLSLVNNATLLSCYSSLFRYSELKSNWRYIRQLVVEVSRGYILFDVAMIKAIQSITELAETADVSGEFQSLCRDSLTQLQKTTAKYNNERDEIVQIKQLISSKSALNFDSLADVKIEVLSQINTAIDKGLQALEIDIDFSNEEVSERVLTAVRNLGELAHSRTLFHDFINGVAQRTSFAFLILSPKSIEDVERILKVMDQGVNCFNILGLEDEDEAESVDGSTSFDKTEIEATDELMAETAMSMNSLKVEGAAVDQLISDVGELVTHHNRLEHLIGQDQFAAQMALLKEVLLSSNQAGNETLQAAVQNLHESYEQIVNANENLHGSLNRIQSAVLDLRVVPLAYAFNRFHKYVRNIAQKLGKKIELKVIGDQVRIDKGMIDVLSEPLAHMIRNSIDHGIEKLPQRIENNKPEAGVIEIKAVQKNSMVVISIKDDGAGLNRDKILEKAIRQGILQADTDYSDEHIFQQIFEPGLSTSDVLSETSGRGVGMDVVKSQIQAVGGSVTITSQSGQGTCIQLHLPISAAIQSVVLIEHQGQIMALPERFVSEVISVKCSDIKLMQEQSVMVLRDNIIPLFELDQILSRNKTGKIQTEKAELEVVIIANEKHCAGLVVSSTQGRAEVLIRDVHESLRYMPAVSAAAVLGDGQVVIILDCDGLFQMALSNVQNVLSQAKEPLE